MEQSAPPSYRLCWCRARTSFFSSSATAIKQFLDSFWIFQWYLCLVAAEAAHINHRRTFRIWTQVKSFIVFRLDLKFRVASRPRNGGAVAPLQICSLWSGEVPADHSLQSRHSSIRARRSKFFFAALCPTPWAH